MHGTKLGNILLLGALTVLPGCLIANAALGVFGLMGPPVAQLAGAAYTVAECSYEYGAHDRTPDEVFLAKFDWLLDHGDEPDPAAFAGALSAAVPGPQIEDAPHATVVVASAGDVTGPIARPETDPLIKPIFVAETQRPMEPEKTATPVIRKKTAAPVKRAAVVRAAAAKVPVRPVVRKPAQAAPPPKAAPVHRYAAHAPDPLLTRLDRLENGLAQAEALYLSESADGLRLSVPPCDGDPCAQGVNGGNSLRMPVMRSVPGDSRAAVAFSARAG
ncbi:MAG: hypothetical protein AB7D39_09325 [Pseudodesulfovibrio sp.]|uniref:hypothetical protein n=1 Tax=Pseudodesulfovibrio sp. TaxID=2035812 RepID=UPI003D14B18E